MRHWLNYKTIFKDAIIFENISKVALKSEVKHYLRKIYLKNDDFEKEYKKVVDNIKMYAGDRLCKSILTKEQ